MSLAQAGVSSPLTREQIQTAHLAYLPDPPPLPEEEAQAWYQRARERSAAQREQWARMPGLWWLKGFGT